MLFLRFGARRMIGYQVREILFPEFVHRAFGDPNSKSLLLEEAQLDAADLPGDRLRQLGELEAPDALVRGQSLAHEAEDLARHVRGWCDAAQQHERLRDRQTQEVWTRHHGRFGDE